MYWLPCLSSNVSIGAGQSNGLRMNAHLGWSIALLMLGIAGCSGGAAVSSVGTSNPGTNCSGACADANSLLTVADVELVIAQGVAEAQARGAKATIAVVDRVGNVLAVYRMGAAASRPVIIASALDAMGNAAL